MFKKLLLSAIATTCVLFASSALAAPIQTSTQVAFNDVNNDTSFDSDDYLNPIYNYTLSVNQFDDNGGLFTLVGAVITLDGFMEGFIGFENLSTTATSEVSGSISSSIELSTNTGTTLVTVLPTFSTTFSAPVFDGVIDFGGTSGVTTTASPVPVTATNTVTVTDTTTLALFLGTGTIDLDVDANSSANTTNVGGFVTTQSSVVSAASMEIYYLYEVATVSVSAPSIIAIFGLILAFVGVRSRRK